LTRPPQTDPIQLACGAPHHPGWLRRNHRLASVGTGGWLQSESPAAFIGIRTHSKDDRWRTPQRRHVRYVSDPDISQRSDADLQRELDALERKREILNRPRGWPKPAADDPTS
jgi:arginase family enzyme